MYKVRFNLGKGTNFMKWKVTSPNGQTRYYNPEEVTLLMKGCYVRNQIATAVKIYNGQNKAVCAWIEAEELKVTKKPTEAEAMAKVSYNPRVTPHWMLNGKIVDNTTLGTLVTAGRSVYLKSNAGKQMQLF